ncbi:MAG: hypothetical protein MAG795_01242 [Candidatus Woesearchaeota archaeon]|nr:hypothetical protein [Candidatus Woesearchaeota archaeon]
MKNFIGKQLGKNNNLLKHSLVVLIGSVFANLFNYLYHLFMGRALGPEQYGVLGSLFAIIYVFSVLNGTIARVISRYVSHYNVKEADGKIKSLLMKSLKTTGLLSLILFGIFGLFSGYVARFLNIDSRIPVIITAIYGFFTLLSPTFNGALNGLQKFKTTSILGVISTFSKLIFGISLVYLGYGVNGAIVGMMLAGILQILIAGFSVRKVFTSKAKKIRTKSMRRYLSPALFGNLVPMIMINLDIVLVKHYLSSKQAGYYAAASMIAKVIWFASGVLVNVMFPKVAEMQDRKKDATKILKATMFYTTIIAFCAVMIYFAVPGFIVNVLYGSSYKIYNIIGLFGLALGLYSISSVIINYNLALKRKNFVYILLSCLLIELFSILMFHSSLIEIVKIMVVVNTLMLALLLITVREELGFNNVQIISNNTSI